MEVSRTQAEALDELYYDIQGYIEDTIEEDTRLADIKRDGLAFAIFLRGMIEDMRTREKHIQKDLLSIAYTSMKNVYDGEPGK